MTTLPPWHGAAHQVGDLVAALALGASRFEPAPDGRHGRCTQLDHALQCAALLAEAFPDDEELQVAGLLHDIGHALRPDDVRSHGQVAGAWVADLLGPRVAEIIELHVDAKRYLVTTEPGYRDRLSAGSTVTLRHQGDAMTPDELAAFTARLHHRDALVLRRADDRAKSEGIDAGRILDWVPVLERLITARHGERADRPDPTDGPS
jgi:predicted HD phosphohydrolase